MERKQEVSSGEGKKVVVIGGGVAGAFAAKSLQFGSDFTLIDPKDYFEIPWASLRATVEPSFADRSVIHHKDYLTNGWLVTSRAIDIDQGYVSTANGRSIPYDYLVIATGHDDPITETRTQRLKQYQSDHERIKSSESILIVGGGPTGVELAAEIAVDFREKKVILVHDGSRLLEFLGPKASDKTLDWLKSRNVEVKLNCEVDLSRISSGNKNYVTSSGEIIQADCHFLCIGKPLGSEWLMDTFLRDNLDEFGRLKVDLNMRVKGHKNIFAIGDITNVKEMKQGYMAQRHATVVSKNIKLLMKGGMEEKLAVYEPKKKKPTAIVSLGRQDAVAQFPYATVIGLVPGLIKSKDLYVGKTRKQIGIHF